MLADVLKKFFDSIRWFKITLKYGEFVEDRLIYWLKPG